ncbi:MAG: hypothetical protein AB1502_11770 [Thermodesulfobacteriota bacterium]
MLLIFEIILSIAAWRKGWRGWALIPSGSVLVIAFIVGAVAGATGYSQTQVRDLTVALLPLDLLCVGVLIWMAAKGRKIVAVASQRLDPKEMEVAANRA